jgi:hypothetical protein
MYIKSGGTPEGKHGNVSRLNIKDYLYVFAWSRTYVYAFLMCLYFSFICLHLFVWHCHNLQRNLHLSHHQLPLEPELYTPPPVLEESLFIPDIPDIPSSFLIHSQEWYFIPDLFLVCSHFIPDPFPFPLDSDNNNSTRLSQIFTKCQQNIVA